MVQLENWQIAVISICVVLFLFINAGVIIYILKIKKSKMSSNHQLKQKEEEMKIETPAILDEGFFTTDTSIEQEKIDMYGKQYALVASLNTAPHRKNNPVLYQQQQQQQTIPNQPVVINQPLRAFSLTPLNNNNTSSPSSEETNSFKNTDSVYSNRTTSPFQSHAPSIYAIWRGPTPPWTQTNTERQS